MAFIVGIRIHREMTFFGYIIQVLWKQMPSLRKEKLCLSFGMYKIRHYMQRSDSVISNPIKASESGYEKEESSRVDQCLEESTLVGEDAAVFKLSSQKLSSWIYFTIVLGVVLTILNFIWIDPRTGYGNAFIQAISSLSDNHEVCQNSVCEIICLIVTLLLK